MTRLVAGNWKMHGLLAEAQARAAALAQWVATAGIGGAGSAVELAVFPPCVQLERVRAMLPVSVGVGVQDVHEAVQGAFTGSVSAEMARDAGAGWAIVGHSERRRGLGESEALVARKAAAALRAGLRPVLCVGEDSHERDAGRAVAVVEAQLGAVTAVVGTAGLAQLVVAYEPVWAIGTGRNASPAQVGEMHAAIRGYLRLQGAESVRVLYGGSVNPGNAAALFAVAGVDGALVGGASLVPEQFIAICQSAAEVAGGAAGGVVP
jgi:triosephosphate isomerase